MYERLPRATWLNAMGISDVPCVCPCTAAVTPVTENVGLFGVGLADNAAPHSAELYTSTPICALFRYTYTALAIAACVSCVKPCSCFTLIVTSMSTYWGTS